MKHAQKIKKLGRESSQRKALMKSLARELVIQKRIKTTLAKAKALRPYIEKIITKAKEDNVSKRRQVRNKVGEDKKVLDILFNDLGPGYKDRPGGYTRILKLPPRSQDNSPQALIEFVE